MKRLLMGWMIMQVVMMDGLAETVAEQLLAGYEAIETLSCDFRRETKSPAATGRRLSRVYYQRPDMLHVDNFSPIRRRIVSDGTNFFSYIEGDPKGFSRPVTELDGEWLDSLRNVPGTPMEHLVKLRGIADEELEGDETYPVKRGYQAEKVYAVLSLDAEGRLALIEFFASANRKIKTAEYRYRGFVEATPGVWVSGLIEATLWINRDEIRETSRLSNLTVNEPVAASLFVPDNFFEGVEFTSRLEEIYGN